MLRPGYVSIYQLHVSFILDVSKEIKLWIRKHNFLWSLSLVSGPQGIQVETNYTEKYIEYQVHHPLIANRFLVICNSKGCLG